MNSMGELVETILSRINIADTNELAEAVESWRGASGGASLPDAQDGRRPGTFLLLGEIGIICCVRRIRCREPD